MKQDEVSAEVAVHTGGTSGVGRATDRARVATADDKLAVVEALYRFAAGIDLHDNDLLASAFAENAVSDFGPAAAKAGFEYPVLEGRESIVAALSTSLRLLDTTHSVSNPRVRVDGDEAHLEAMVEAQHVLRNDHSRHYLMKNRYDVELVRQGEVWVIQRVTIDNVWRAGDPAVLSVVQWYPLCGTRQDEDGGQPSIWAGAIDLGRR